MINQSINYENSKQYELAELTFEMALKIQKALQNEYIVYGFMREKFNINDNTLVKDIGAISSDMIQKHLRKAAFRTRKEKVFCVILVYELNDKKSISTVVSNLFLHTS